MFQIYFKNLENQISSNVFISNFSHKEMSSIYTMEVN